MEAAECGAASLGIILAYHGRIVPLAELRAACGVSRDGSKASNILRAARSYGLEAHGFKMELSKLETLPCPFIVFWQFYHFLVVEGITENRVYLNDPATGRRQISHKEFDEGYTGLVLLFRPGEAFRRGGRRPGLIPALRERLGNSGSAVVYCILLGLLLVPPVLVAPVMVQVFVDQVLIHAMTDWLRPLLLGMVLLALLQAGLRGVQLHFLRRLRIKLSVVLGGRFMWHLLRLPVGYYAQRSAGEVCSRAEINDEIASILSGRLATTAIDAVMAVLYLAVMAAYDVGLTLIGLSFAAVNFLVLKITGRARADATLRVGIDEGAAAGAAVAGLQSVETLKAGGLESEFFAGVAGRFAKAFSNRQRLEIQGQLLGLLPAFLAMLSTTAILALGGLKVMNGQLTIGGLVAFQGLMAAFLGPINGLLGLGGALQELGASMTRIDDVLESPVDPATELKAPAADQVEMFFKLQGSVEVRDLTFGYSRLEAPLIRNLNLTVKPGRRVAIIGGSGSGKSTIARLICGLFEPWNGEIRFDGRERATVPRRIVSSSVALVDQDVFLFGGTVRENLTLWKDTIPEADLVRACKDAEIHEAIISLPGGYEGLLAEGAQNLSGGQRQRLEIARALAGNPSILLLDEATSALDTETERRIMVNLRRRGCTCIIVAHRLSTIRDCDEILVLDRGEVVQRGTHDVMRGTDGPYLRLIRTEGEALVEA